MSLGIFCNLLPEKRAPWIWLTQDITGVMLFCIILYCILMWSDTDAILRASRRDQLQGGSVSNVNFLLVRGIIHLFFYTPFFYILHFFLLLPPGVMPVHHLSCWEEWNTYISGIPLGITTFLAYRKIGHWLQSTNTKGWLWKIQTSLLGRCNIYYFSSSSISS